MQDGSEEKDGDDGVEDEGHDEPEEIDFDNGLCEACKCCLSGLDVCVYARIMDIKQGEKRSGVRTETYQGAKLCR